MENFVNSYVSAKNRSIQLIGKYRAHENIHSLPHNSACETRRQPRQLTSSQVKVYQPALVWYLSSSLPAKGDYRIEVQPYKCIILVVNSMDIGISFKRLQQFCTGGL